MQSNILTQRFVVAIICGILVLDSAALLKQEKSLRLFNPI